MKSTIYFKIQLEKGVYVIISVHFHISTSTMLHIFAIFMWNSKFDFDKSARKRKFRTFYIDPCGTYFSQSPRSNYFFSLASTIEVVARFWGTP